MIFQPLGDQPVAGLGAIKEQGGGVGIFLKNAGRVQIELNQGVEPVGKLVVRHIREICPGHVGKASDAKMALVQGKRSSADNALAGHDEVTKGGESIIKGNVSYHSLQFMFCNYREQKRKF